VHSTGTTVKADDINWPTKCVDAKGLSVPCGGQQQQCGKPFRDEDGPIFHIRDSSCGVNDPNGIASLFQSTCTNSIDVSKIQLTFVCAVVAWCSVVQALLSTL
jgi:hypothetical protein